MECKKTCDKPILSRNVLTGRVQTLRETDFLVLNVYLSRYLLKPNGFNVF